jgi:O-acetyl-ADP-ribose deacetylase (regulator of RNase III)
MPANPDEFTVEEIIADLRVLRERGLVRLRHTDLADLNRAANAAGVVAPGGGSRGVEALLRAAVENLGGGELAAAARATFGLDGGARDRPAQDRRRKAALVYGVSVERFRKHHERIVLEQVAEEVLKLVLEPTLTMRQAAASHPDFGRQIVLDGEVGSIRMTLIVHVEPIELLSGVDIIVVPQNTYLELPQHFKSSVSAAVRWAAAVKSSDGQIIADVVADELRDWVRQNARLGLAVAPGTTAPTSSGELAKQGIRRIYHVAVAAPRPGTNDYDVAPTAIAGGVRNALAIARRERESLDPELRSIGFPLFGAGRGGLDPAISFTWMWAALERDIREHGPWEVHFITRQQSVADLIVTKLAEAGVISARPGNLSGSLANMNISRPEANG